MPFRRLTAVAVLLLLALSSAAVAEERIDTAAGRGAALSEKLIHHAVGPRGQYIVQLTPGDELAPAVAYALAEQYRFKLGSIYELAIRGFAARMTEAQAAALSADPRVRLVEQDVFIIHPTSVITQTGSDTDWALDRIDQRTGFDGTFQYVKNGTGVRVYIIDAGINQNPDTWGAVGSFSVLPGGYAGDAYENVGGHGTKVTSIAVGPRFGVAKNARYINVRVVGQDAGSDDVGAQVLDGLEWMMRDRALHPSTPAVANMSMDIAGVNRQSAIEQAVINAIDQKIIMVVGAGNATVDQPGYNDACGSSPAALGDPSTRPGLLNPNGRSTITVSAMNIHGQRTGFLGGGTAKGGPCVDIFAPGLNVRSWGTFAAPETFEGTSAAAPFVTGVIAAYLEGRGSNYDPNEVEAALKRNATAGVLTNLTPGTPNLLVYSRVDLWQ